MVWGIVWSKQNDFYIYNFFVMFSNLQVFLVLMPSDEPFYSYSFNSVSKSDIHSACLVVARSGKYWLDSWVIKSTKKNTFVKFPVLYFWYVECMINALYVVTRWNDQSFRETNTVRAPVFTQAKPRSLFSCTCRAINRLFSKSTTDEG